MSFTFQNYSNAVPNTLSTAVNNSIGTFVVGTTGAPWNGPFPYVIAIDRGTTSQEVCLVTNYSSGLVVTRNYDGNGAYGHNIGATIEFVSPASDWTDFNLHATDSTRDDHLALMRTDGSRHNLAANHALGVSIVTGTPFPSSVGDTQADGSGSALVRADHVHGRTDTWTTYRAALEIAALTLPLPVGSVPTNAVLANGGWYNQADQPALYALLGQNFTPAPIANPGIASNPFNASIHFAVPTIGVYVNSVLQWFMGIQWMIYL